MMKGQKIEIKQAEIADGSQPSPTPNRNPYSEIAYT
jgi:hypothetical protein